MGLAIAEADFFPGFLQSFFLRHFSFLLHTGVKDNAGIIEEYCGYVNGRGYRDPPKETNPDGP